MSVLGVREHFFRDITRGLIVIFYTIVFSTTAEALTTDQFSQHGFYYDRFSPHVHVRRESYIQEEPIASTTCSRYQPPHRGAIELFRSDYNRFHAARSRCLQRNQSQPVRLHLSLESQPSFRLLGHDVILDRLSPLSSSLSNVRADPLARRGQVRIIAVSTAAQLVEELLQLVERCDLIEDLMVYSHGFSNQVAFESDRNFTIYSFLHEILNPCFMTNRIKMQFVGCQIACREGVEDVRSDLQATFRQFPHMQAQALFSDSDVIPNGVVISAGSVELPLTNYFRGTDSIRFQPRSNQNVWFRQSGYNFRSDFDTRRAEIRECTGV